MGALLVTEACRVKVLPVMGALPVTEACLAMKSYQDVWESIRLSLKSKTAWNLRFAKKPTLDGKPPTTFTEDLLTRRR